jgi:large subunit ribosomal protein L31
MKTDIHPKYFPKAEVKCACGAEFIIGSTSEELNVEICANCHPFFTGKEKLLDIAGKVEKFKARRAKAAENKTTKKSKIKKEKKASKE